jgi:hypothetical protein
MDPSSLAEARSFESGEKARDLTTDVWECMELIRLIEELSWFHNQTFPCSEPEAKYCVGKGWEVEDAATEETVPSPQSLNRNVGLVVRERPWGKDQNRVAPLSTPTESN